MQTQLEKLHEQGEPICQPIGENIFGVRVVVCAVVAAC